MMWSILILFFFLVSFTLTEEISQYHGFKVYETVPKTEGQTKFLVDLAESSPQYDFWVLPRAVNDKAYILVSPTYDSQLQEALTTAGLSYNIINKDLSESARSSQQPVLEGRSGNADITDFARYYRHGEINNYLDSLAAKYPDRILVKTVGRSHENRPIKTIAITNGDKRLDKKVIFIDAGIHAREWIAPATAVYVIYQLAERFEQNKHLLEDFNWLILPVVNPDGYEYTHTKDRFWRKTRKPITNRCVGTDPNRNFDFHWAEIGTSASPCQPTYHGQRPFSEPETRVLRDVLHSLRGRGQMYLTLHSFGSYFLYPWGWTRNLPSNWRDMHEVSEAGAKAIEKASGRKYKVGSSSNVLYPAAGGSDDYAYAKVGIPISITVELPFGGSGFDPSPKMVPYIVEESWIGIKAMAQKVAEKYN